MNKAKIKGMIQEKLQMIETLQRHVKVLSELIDEEVITPRGAGLTPGANNIAQQIESYRQQIMKNVQSSLPTAPEGGMGMNSMPGGMPGMPQGGSPDMKRHFEEMKREMEKKGKE